MRQVAAYKAHHFLIWARRWSATKPITENNEKIDGPYGLPLYILNDKEKKSIFRFKKMTDVLLQEGGSPQTEQQLTEMIRENLMGALKEGKNTDNGNK